MHNHIYFIIFIESYLSDVGARRCLAQKNNENSGETNKLPIQTNVGARRCLAQERNSNTGQGTALPLQHKRGYIPKSLNEFVGNFKSFTTKKFNKLNNISGISFWQRNYYEHIIRNEKELNKIREYIIYNPINWALDEDNPINQSKKLREG